MVSSSKDTRGEIVTLIATAIVILIGVTTFVATTFLNKNNKLTYQSKAATRCDYACLRDGGNQAECCYEEQPTQAPEPTKPPSQPQADNTPEPKPQVVKEEKTIPEVPQGPLPGDYEKWKCPGPNCDKCGFQGWWGEGCSGFAASKPQDAPYAGQRVSGSLSACGGAHLQCSGEGSTSCIGPDLYKCGNDGCLRKDSSTQSSSAQCTGDMPKGGSVSFSQTAFNECLRKDPSRTPEQCRQAANEVITPTPISSMVLQTPSGNVPVYEKSLECRRDCGGDCTSIPDPKTNKKYYVCPADLPKDYLAETKPECLCDEEKGTYYGPNCPRQYIGQNCEVQSTKSELNTYKTSGDCFKKCGRNNCQKIDENTYTCTGTRDLIVDNVCKEEKPTEIFKLGDACFQCQSGKPQRADCTQDKAITTDQAYGYILQNDCRCVDGKWQGGNCDGWQRGKTCGKGSNCLPGGARCSDYTPDLKGITFDETGCCSGYCQRSSEGGICASKEDITSMFTTALSPTPTGSNVLTNRCLPGQTRCYGDVIQECKNFLWATIQTCGGGCLESDGKIDCKSALTIVAAPTGVVKADGCKTQAVNTACNDQGKMGVCVGTGLFNLGGNKCLECLGSTVPVAGQGCVDLSQKIGGCTTDMPMRIQDGKCFACVKKVSDAYGDWVAVNSQLCVDYDDAISKGQGAAAKPSALDILNNTISTEDAYKIRRKGYEQAFTDGDLSTKIGVTALNAGDMIGGFFSNIGKGAQRSVATLGDTVGLNIGDRNAEAEGFGQDYQKHLNTALEMQKQGKTYEVTLWQAIGTGVWGGIKYAHDFANGITLGTIDVVTSNVIKNSIETANEQVLTNLYGDNEPLKKIARNNQKVGSDITNGVAILVPAAKGFQAIGSGVNAVGVRMAASGIRGGGTLQALGTVVRTGARGAEMVSPEYWFGGFIKSKPITTSLESLTTIAGKSQVGQVVSGLGKTIGTTIATKAPIVTKVTSVGFRTAEKIIDFAMPRSALTYTTDEAARYLARDIRMGLVEDGAAAALRATKNYHISLKDIADVDKFTTTITREGVRGFDVQALNSQLREPIVRQGAMGTRLTEIRQTPSATGPVNPADITKYAKQFKGTNTVTALAEQIIHDKELAAGRVIIGSPQSAQAVAEAKALAESILSKKPAVGVRDTIVDAFGGKFGIGRIADIKKEALESLKVDANMDKIKSTLESAGFSNKNAKALDKAASELSGKLRGEKMPERLTAIKNADPAKVVAELAGVDKKVASDLGKKFKGIYDPDELAEAVLHEWERIDKTPHIGNPDKLAAAKAYAQDILTTRAERKGFGLFGAGEKKAIESAVLKSLPATADQTLIKQTLENFGYVKKDIDKTASKLGEALRQEKMPERLTSLRDAFKDPNFNQVKQDIEQSLVNDPAAKANLDKYSKQFKKIKDPDQLAENIFHEWEKDWQKTGRVLTKDELAHEMAAAQTYSGKITADKAVKPFGLNERIGDAIAKKIGKGTIVQEKQVLTYMQANGLAMTDDVIKANLERFGYRGDKTEAIERITQQFQDIERARNLPQQVKNVNQKIIDLTDPAKGGDPNAVASRRLADPFDKSDLKVFQEFDQINDVDGLTEAIVNRYRKNSPGGIINNDQYLQARAQAENLIALRNKQPFGPVDYIEDLFGRGRKADIEHQVMAKLPVNADKDALKKALLANSYDEKALVNVLDGLYDKFKTPAVNKQWSFFERVTGLPQKLEDDVFNKFIDPTGQIVPHTNTSIIDALKENGYPLSDRLGNKNLTAAVSRIEKRLSAHGTGGAAQPVAAAARPAASAARPAQPRPAAAVRPPKQGFNPLERLTGKPQRLENQVRRQLGGARTLDEYKNALRAAGYAEREIDAAAAKIQASFPQAAPMAGVPQNVPIRQQQPPAKPVQPQVNQAIERALGSNRVNVSHIESSLKSSLWHATNQKDIEFVIRDTLNDLADQQGLTGASRNQFITQLEKELNIPSIRQEALQRAQELERASLQTIPGVNLQQLKQPPSNLSLAQVYKSEYVSSGGQRLIIDLNTDIALRYKVDEAVTGIAKIRAKSGYKVSRTDAMAEWVTDEIKYNKNLQQQMYQAGGGQAGLGQVICNGAVCREKAFFTDIIARRIGLDSEVMVGQVVFPGAAGRHAWNYIPSRNLVVDATNNIVLPLEEYARKYQVDLSQVLRYKAQ